MLAGFFLFDLARDESAGNLVNRRGPDTATLASKFGGNTQVPSKSFGFFLFVYTLYVKQAAFRKFCSESCLLRLIKSSVMPLPLGMGNVISP